PAAPVVVEGRASRWASITVVAGDRTADVPGDMWTHLAPLLAARALPAPADPSEGGLDRSTARLRWRATDATGVEVVLGATDFNHHLVYATRGTTGPVYLLAADSLRPVLALAGVTLPEPT